MSKTTAKTDEPQASTTAAAETTKQEATKPAGDAQTASDAPTTDDAAEETKDEPASPDAPPKPSKRTKTAAGSKPKPASKKKMSTKDSPTLIDLGERFFAALEKEGKSDSTLSSYRMDFGLAVRELGGATKLSALTPAKVQAYFDSDVVTRARTGRVKAKPTVDKTRRVLRLALWYAEEQGMVEKAPIPEEAA